MTDAQQLRKALKGMEVRSIDGTHTSSILLLSDKAVDAILDAVLSALPERQDELVKQGNGFVPNFYKIGENQMLDRTIALLEAAKSQSQKEGE